MYEHIRNDNSTYHVIEYNETDGSVSRKYTAQGETSSYTLYLFLVVCPRRLC